MTNNAPKRISVSLAGDAARLLTHLAESQDLSENAVIRKALATEYYIYEELAQGSKILIQKPDKSIREVVFR